MSGGNNSNNSTTGVGFAGLLAIAFIVLKLCKVIDWAWIWVLSPIWISIVIAIVVIIIAVVYHVVSDRRLNRR